MSNTYNIHLRRVDIFFPQINYFKQKLGRFHRLYVGTVNDGQRYRYDIDIATPISFYIV